MSNNIDYKIIILQNKFTKLITELETLPEKSLKQAPSPERWSLIQVVEHLILSLQFVLRDLPEMKQLQSEQKSLKNRALYFVVLFVLHFGIRVRVPSKEMEPTGAHSLKKLREDWEITLAWLKHFCDSADRNRLTQAYFKHPVCGPLNISQVLKLAIVHFESHRKKIEIPSYP